jgi:MFS family permease
MAPQHTVDTSLKANTTNETTPLLTSVEPEPILQSDETAIQAIEANRVRDEDDNTPLPGTQIFLLCCTRVVEPIAFFSIFPYINPMIEHVGSVEQADVGFYSGLIESLFSLTQMCVMIFWGKAADRWGRKPVLVLSLFGIAIANTLFGMSQSIQQMVFARCFAGMFAGTVVTVRAMFSENSTKHTQAKAFSYFAFAGNIGIFIGQIVGKSSILYPAIHAKLYKGGALERPADKYPSLFGTQFFRDYPYALPGLVTSVIALSAAVTTLLFVNEVCRCPK